MKEIKLWNVDMWENFFQNASTDDPCRMWITLLCFTAQNPVVLFYVIFVHSLFNYIMLYVQLICMLSKNKSIKIVNILCTFHLSKTSYNTSYTFTIQLTLTSNPIVNCSLHKPAFHNEMFRKVFETKLFTQFYGVCSVSYSSGWPALFLLFKGWKSIKVACCCNQVYTLKHQHSNTGSDWVNGLLPD